MYSLPEHSRESFRWHFCIFSSMMAALNCTLCRCVDHKSSTPVSTTTWTNVGLMLGHCLRRWPNINPTLVVFTRSAFFSHLVLIYPYTTLNKQMNGENEAFCKSEITDSSRSPSVGSMFGQRRKRWPNIDPTLGTLGPSLGTSAANSRQAKQRQLVLPGESCRWQLWN